MRRCGSPAVTVAAAVAAVTLNRGGGGGTRRPVSAGMMRPLFGR